MTSVYVINRTKHIYIYIYQHCTDEAQKAETVLSTVRYRYIYIYIYMYVCITKQSNIFHIDFRYMKFIYLHCGEETNVRDTRS